MQEAKQLPFLANNQFFYYADLARAAGFYGETLGFRQVADYGMACIFQLARTSFVTLVEADKGMHTIEEPKTVTLGIIVPAVEDWYAYVCARDVHIHRPLSVQPGQAHDGFVALDPEGYFLEFQRFNSHPENEQLGTELAALPLMPTEPEPARSGLKLTVSGTTLWLYYTKIDEANRFFRDGLGLQQIVEQKSATIFRASTSGFIGTVLSGQGLHSFTQEKAVTLSFLTDSTTAMEAWFARMQARPDFRLRSQEIVARERYHAFVGYSPGNYYLEFNYFLHHDDNQLLMQALQA